MLIVLSGVETIHRKWFAGAIIASMNTFEVDGHIVDFTKDQPEVYKDGVIVHRPGTTTGGGVNDLLVDKNNNEAPIPAGIATKAKIDQLYDDTFLTGTRDHHYAGVFTDLGADYNFNPLEWGGEVGYQGGDYKQPHNYSDVIAAYNTSTLSNYVISGCFSKRFIDSIRNDLGANNVTVVNIIRNPSAAFMSHPKPPAYFVKNSTYTKEFDNNKLTISLLTSANLIKFSDIQTLKFEDIMKAGSFTINGIKINIPHGHAPLYNNWITSWEYNNPVTQSYGNTATDLISFNQLYSNFLPAPVPIGNVFETMGYSPLDYSTITTAST